MTDYHALAVDLARAHRDALVFPNRPIVRIPHDPLAHAANAIDDARADFEFALMEAFNSGDVDGLDRLVAQLTKCADGLLVAETMAKDLAERMRR